MNIINVFIVNFDKFNVSLVDKIIIFINNNKKVSKLQVAQIVIYTLSHVVFLMN